MKRNKVIQRLRGYTSRYSFLRVLNQICFLESTSYSSMTCHDLSDDDKRLINSEIAFIVGLWLDNIYFEAEEWLPEKDCVIKGKVYELLNEYHKTFNLSSQKESYNELVIYEGDGAYHWQYITLSKYKYEDSAEYLERQFGYSVSSACSMFDKVLSIIQNRVARVDVSNSNEISTLFIIPGSVIRDNLSNTELKALSRFVTKVGEHTTGSLDSIITFNEYQRNPVIILHNGDYFIPNLYVFAKAINESPFYWIGELNNSNELRIKIGKANESITYGLLSRLENPNILEKGIIVKDVADKRDITDIDCLLSIDDEYFVFQVKSKKLTQKALDGATYAIMDDFSKAVVDSYNQGVKCVSSLLESEKFLNLNKYNPPKDPNQYHIICITGDYYPTLTPMCIASQRSISDSMAPLVAMSVYDLECITYLFDTKLVKNYFLFREECSHLHVYANNESFYIGKFIAILINPEEKRVYREEKLPREYGVLMDYIIQTARNKNIELNAISHYWDLIEDEKSSLLTLVAGVFQSISNRVVEF